MNFSNTPYSKSSGVKLGKLARGVSIIGVGSTRFGHVLETPELLGLSQKELAAWAAQEAMDDAGVNPKEINFLSFAQLVTIPYYGEIGANIYMMDWFGMRGKQSSKHEEACASSYCAFDEAVNAIASGKFDIALVCGSDTDRDFTNQTNPPHIRRPGKEFVPPIGSGTYWIQDLQNDSAYARWSGAAVGWIDESAHLYAKKHGISKRQMKDAINAITISLRHNAAKNPLAFLQQELEDEAKEKGYDNVKDYFDADFQYSPYHTRLSVLNHVDGGGAMVLCASDIAKKYHPKPINILGVGISTMDGRHPRSMTRHIEESYRQVFELTGIKGDEIDLMYCTDFTTSHILQATEMCGYVPEGKAWEYALNGEFGFDGIKPVNTQGGSIGFGHAFGAQVFEQGVEAVRQMRGECGERQVNKIPKIAFLSGYGDSQQNTAILLKTQE